MFSASKIFANLPTANPRVIKPPRNRVSSNRSAHLIETFRQASRGQVGKHEIFFVWIARRSYFQTANQVFFFARIGCDLFFRPAPGRRTRPAAGSSGN